MDTVIFIVYIKTDEKYVDIAKDVDAIFETSNYNLGRPLPKGEYKNVTGLIKYELRRKIMTLLH